jgi:hypothetical protein
MNDPSDPAETKRINDNCPRLIYDSVPQRLLELAEQLDRALASRRPQTKKDA